MIIIFIRAVVTFIVLLIVMRLMGKRQIGEMQPFELVITLIIAELACIPMADISVPLIYGISAIIAMFILHQLLSIIDQSGQIPKRIISGKPSLVLNKQGVDFMELRRNNMDIEDLIESMRSAGYFSLDDLDYAIFESNGKLSAKEKQNYNAKNSALPLLIISEGKTIDKNMNLVGLTKKELLDILKNNSIKSIKKVGVMTIDGNGKTYLQCEGKHYQTFNLELKNGVAW